MPPRSPPRSRRSSRRDHRDPRDFRGRESFRDSRSSRDPRDSYERDRNRDHFRHTDRPRDYSDRDKQFIHPDRMRRSSHSSHFRDRSDSRRDRRDFHDRNFSRDRRDDRRPRNRDRDSDRDFPPPRITRPIKDIPVPPYQIDPNGDLERRICQQTLWDLPPEGFEGKSVAEVAAVEPDLILEAIKSNAPVSNRHSRRLYVGNVPLGITDDELRSFFNSALKQAGVAKFSDIDPILSCQINQDKGFAFIEFHYIEDTTSAIAFDGVSLQGNALKVRRPKDFGIDQDILPETRLQLDQIPGIVRKKCPPHRNRLIIGGVPDYFNEDQMKRILRPFGMLMSFELPLNPSTVGSKGYAYCQFCREIDTENVLHYLPLIDLAGSHLKVGFADRSPPPPPSWYEPPVNADLELLVERQHSRVIQMIGVLKEEDFQGSFEDLTEDVQFECESYGVVVSISIPSPGQAGFGKIFVEFELEKDCIKALKQLPRRAFNNRKFLCAMFPTDMYIRKEFY
ncbi:hypothetical protein P9112_006512 [Eukaryota sp. TZLM1-RC]